jgi:general secretion pathway protein J
MKPERGCARIAKQKHSVGIAGFTLLELLVVMALLSLIMTGLVSAMRTMGQTESKIDARLEQLENIRSARAFLQQTLARISIMPVDATGATGKSVIPFTATAEELTWVGILPARANLGGRYFFRLAIENADNQSVLVIRFAPWRPDIIYTDWPHAESRILFHNIQKLQVQAQGLPTTTQDPKLAWPVGWQDGWPVVDVAPEQVRLTLTDSSGPWPYWVFPLRALSQGDNSYGRVVAGGGAG